MRHPIVITHPSTLLHNGLRHLFTKSCFRPVRIATTLTKDLEAYLRSQDSCVWLTGVDKCVSVTTALVRKVVAANTGVKAVILSASHQPEDVVAALKAGACGFLCQDIPGDRLLRSLELITLGEMIVHPQFASSLTAANENQAIGDLDDDNPFIARVTAEVVSENETGNIAPSLSRREMVILRMLMQGGSNKVIARSLVITESTVKVHMKAILRKLRLQNRTQAAIWARNHVSDDSWEQQTASAGPAH